MPNHSPQCEHYATRKKPGGRKGVADEVLQLLVEAASCPPGSRKAHDPSALRQLVAPLVIASPATLGSTQAEILSRKRPLHAGGAPSSSARPARLCPAFKGGHCSSGSSCPMRHETCFFFQQPGGCRYGDTCYYRHDQTKHVK